MRSSASRLIVALFAFAVAAFVTSGSPTFAEDDHGDYRFSATALGVGSGAVSGAIDSADILFDVDYFSFPARRGVRYTIVLDRVSVVDANVSVVNSLARGAGLSPDQTSGESGTQKTIEWSARTTDTYFVEVAGTINNSDGSFYLGGYTVGVFEDTSLLDRHPETRGGASNIVVGNVYQGAISPWTNQPSLTGTVHGGDDVDYFTFAAQRGVRYTVEVDVDTSEGVEIAIGDTFDGIADSNDGIGNTLVWIAPGDATYFVVIGGTDRVRDPVGTYALKLNADATLKDQHAGSQEGATVVSFGNAHQGSVSPANDNDYFSFPAERGVKYTIDVALGTAAGVGLSILDTDAVRMATNGGVGETLEWLAPGTGMYLAVVSASTQVPDVVGTYSLNVTTDSTLRDRHGEVPGDATSVSLGNAHQGAISPANDLDYFSIQAERGVGYSVSVELGTAGGAVIAIEDADGETIDTNGGLGTSLTWTALLSGSYYVVVSHSPQAPQGVGTYSLTVAANTDLEDRHQDTALSGTPISFGTVYQGAVSPAVDLDYFFFPAERGVEYTLDLTYGTAQAVTLSVNTLTGAPGAAARNFGESNVLRWIAPTSENYYVEISASAQAADPTGTYSLKVTPDSSLRDRHSDNAVTATRIGFGNAIAGAVSPADDVDYFFFTAEAGVGYAVDLRPGTAEAVRFSVENSQVEYSASNFGVDNSLEWTAPVTGGYILKVSASGRVGNPVGTYQITVTREGDARPPGPSTPTPQPTPGPTPAPTPRPDETALILDSRTAPTGGTVSLPIRLNQAAEVTSLGFNLHYDPAVLRVKRVLKGSRLSEATFSFNDDVPGVIRFGFAVTEGAFQGGSAAVVEFDVTGDNGSVSPLTLSDALVSHSSSDPLEVTLIGADLHVGPRISGDGDGDGKITALDGLMAIKSAGKASAANPALDVNGDGVIDISDARQILAMAAQDRN